MPTPSDFLTAAKAIVEAEKDNERYTPKIRSDLSSIDDTLANLLSLLAKIEEYVVLGSSTVAGDKRNVAMQNWEAFSAGAHAKPEELRPFIESSPLLDSIYRQGFDITQVYRFSDHQIQLAKGLGDRFPILSDGLKSFRRARAGRIAGDKTILLKCTDESKEFLQFLELNDIATIQRMMIHMPDRSWKQFRIEWFGTGDREREVLVVFSVNSEERAKFLVGEWLNAYVYYIIFDHLTRNRASFELYTDISYRSPADVLHLKGEFDVIGQVANRFVCVECKSGLLGGTRDTILNAVAKITKLTAAMSAVSAA